MTNELKSDFMIFESPFYPRGVKIIENQAFLPFSFVGADKTRTRATPPPRLFVCVFNPETFKVKKV